MGNEKELFNRRKMYSTPRKLDLATLLVIMFMFAMLFAGLAQIPYAPIWFTGMVALFIALVGVSQAILFHGTKPRLASVVSGYFLMAILVVTLYWLRNLQTHRYSKTPDVLITFFCAGWWGIPLGYLAGVLVGGVFLISDAMRKHVSFLRPKSHEDRDSNPWTEDSTISEKTIQTEDSNPSGENRSETS
jgi:hypothetical protein